MIAIVIIGGSLVGLSALVGLVVMLLWNWIMPYLFGLPTVSFWMAWGILFLIGCLFNGMRYACKK